MALIQTLIDPFTATSKTALWNQSTAGSATFTYATTGAKVNFPASSTATTNGDLSSVSFYDLTGSYALVNVLNATATATHADCTFQLVKDGSNTISFQVEAGILYANKYVAAVATVIASVTYSSTTHAWWRIRESGGTIYWDTSTDGKTWTNFTTLANPFVITSVQADINGSCFQAETNPGSFKWINFNNPPVNTTNFFSFFS